MKVTEATSRLRASIWLALVVALGCRAGVPESHAQAIASGVITNLTSFYSLPEAQKMLPHRIKTDILIYFFDATWKVAWGEFAGQPAFLPIYDSPQPFHAGERIAIDGVVIPGRQKFLWDQTKVRVLAESAMPKPIPIQGQLRDHKRLDFHYVEFEGLADTEDTNDSHIVNLGLVADHMRVTALIRRDRVNAPVPWYVGDLVRIHGVYSADMDVNGKIGSLSIWVSSPHEVQVVGTLAQDPRFNRAVTPVDHLRTAKSNVLVKVVGVVRSRDSGASVTIWDNTGQVRVESTQTLPLQIGAPVEAIGYPFSDGLNLILRDGTYRPALGTNAVALATGEAVGQPLRLAARVRDLRRDQIARKIPVDLEGVVLWAHPGTPFIFVADSSGGIRVVHPKLENVGALLPQMLVRVQGVAGSGQFVPVVTNAVVRQLGVLAYPEAQSVSLEQAMTGIENGQWVEMQGYLSSARHTGNLTRLGLSTWGGQFQALLPRDDGLGALVGAIVRVRGVCAAVANDRHQLTGIQLWVPNSGFVQVQTGVPAHPFALPERPLASLRQFSVFNVLNQRVHTRGTVVLTEPGGGFYLQDGNDSVYVMSHQAGSLKPGERVEVVGFPGNEGGRFLLREAIYRSAGFGPQPAPRKLVATAALNEKADGLLVRTEGVLLDLIANARGVRLTLQSSNVLFEAQLDQNVSANQMKSLPVGSLLSLTGVYQLQRDSYGKPRSYLICLRTWNDIHVLQRPPWWSPTRLTRALLTILPVFVLAIWWALTTQQKNQRLREVRTDLQAAKTNLEQRVAERTQQLRQQVTEKENAHTQLAEAQERLMKAARQAGMAEVATGVLHNVGNVLTSVNVSVGVLRNQMRHSHVASLIRVAALLERGKADLAEFLTQDPKGQILPEYLESLAMEMRREHEQVEQEVASLGKHIEHISAIITTQQSYASVGGVEETFDPKDVMEDAIRINQVSYSRRKVRLTRQYETTPSLLADRHVVLQILVNLLSNAKHAVNGRQEGEGNVTVAIAMQGSDRIQWRVTDNGVGIAPENLVRIFTQGFTTRKDGHGFGLHSGAIGAKQLGGQLTAHSDGLGLGTTFVLELPCSPPPAAASA